MAGLSSDQAKKNLGKYAQKGTIPWNKGRPLTEEWRQNLSKSLKGRKSPWKGKHNPNFLGEKNSNWKNGISQKARSERENAMTTLEYKLWREAVFARDNWTCQNCQARGSYLQADHIKSWAKYPELRFAIDNGRTLCMGCHYEVTFNKKIPNGIRWGTKKQYYVS